MISHVSSRASAVSFRHVSWNHEFDSRPSLLPRGCVSSGCVCIASSQGNRAPGILGRERWKSWESRLEFSSFADFILVPQMQSRDAVISMLGQISPAFFSRGGGIRGVNVREI